MADPLDPDECQLPAGLTDFIRSGQRETEPVPQDNREDGLDGPSRVAPQASGGWQGLCRSLLRWRAASPAVGAVRRP